jgi:hypothetical protein
MPNDTTASPIDPQQVREQIVNSLNMAHLTQEEQDDILEHLGAVLLERASLALMKEMSEADLEEMDKLVEEGKSEEAMAVVKRAVPNVDAVVAAEVQAGIVDYKRFLLEEVQKQDAAGQQPQQ